MSIKAKYELDPKEIRVYSKETACIFKKNNEQFGGLSNMATGFPITINNIKIKTAEALYQACRFPHLAELQQKIIEEKSPMTVKMISNANKKKSREDWDSVRLKVMKWCIQVKLAQNFILFGAVLHETGLMSIVENSSKDNFWGAIPNEEGTIFTGKNALGRLLMDLRQAFYGKDSFSLLFVCPPPIENFFLYNEQIGIIDERGNFMNWLQTYWDDSHVHEFVKSSKRSILIANEVSSVFSPRQISLEESKKPLSKAKSTRQKQNNKIKQDAISQANLFAST